MKQKKIKMKSLFESKEQLQQGQSLPGRLVKNFTIGGIVLYLLSWDCSTGNTGQNNKSNKSYTS